MKVPEMHSPLPPLSPRRPLPVLPPDLARRLEPAARLARETGTAVYLVGGSVRDLLLGRESPDIDLVVEGDGLEFGRRLARALDGTVREHADFLTADVTDAAGLHLDVATARAESYRAPAALPEVWPAPLAEDLRRRDFTVNALAVPLAAVSPAGGGPELIALLDPYGGRRDLAERCLRVFHELSFIDDPTRVLRGVRLECRLQFHFSTGTERLVAGALAAGAFDHLTGTRLWRELELLLDDPLGEPEAAPRAVARLAELGVLRAIHPALTVDAEMEERLRRVAAAVRTLPAVISSAVLPSLPDLIGSPPATHRSPSHPSGGAGDATAPPNLIGSPPATRHHPGRFLRPGSVGEPAESTASARNLASERFRSAPGADRQRAESSTQAAGACPALAESPAQELAAPAERPVVPRAALTLLMALSERLSPSARASLAGRLMLAGEDARQLAGFAERLDAARAALGALAGGPEAGGSKPRGPRPSEVVAALAPLAPEELALLLAEPACAHWVRLYVEELRNVVPRIGGADLLAAGHAPGPRIGEALRATRRALLDGDIAPEGELAFALAELSDLSRKLAQGRVKKPARRPIDASTRKPIPTPTGKPVQEADLEPVGKSVEEAAGRPAPEPSRKLAQEAGRPPVQEPAGKPAQEPER